MKKNTVLLLLILLQKSLFSQTIIWIEDFQSYTTHPTQTGSDINLPIGPDWTTSWVDCDDMATYPTAASYGNSYWGTRATGVPSGNKEFVCNDIEGGPCTCANGGGTTNNIITTELIDISSYTNILASVKHRFVGVLECTPLATCDNEYDRVEIYYSLNGGSYVSIGLACDANGSIGGCIPDGNNIRIKIEMGNKANAEYFFLDSIMVVGNSPNCMVLPIEDTKFYGTALDKYNELKWTSTLKNGAFTVQKSDDGYNFEEITQIKITNKTEYSIIDEKPHKITYYKLVYISIDGFPISTDLISLNAKNEAKLEVLRIINYMGEEVTDDYIGLKIYFYNDGSFIKKYKIE